MTPDVAVPEAEALPVAHAALRHVVVTFQRTETRADRQLREEAARAPDELTASTD